MAVQLWHIYFVRNCQHVRPEPKDKLVVPVCEDGDNYIGFLINSNISEFVRNREELLACQGYLRASDHSALSHDSYISCDSAYTFDESELADIRHPVSHDAIGAIIHAVNHCTVLERVYKRKILESGNNLLSPDETDE